MSSFHRWFWNTPSRRFLGGTLLVLLLVLHGVGSVTAQTPRPEADNIHLVLLVAGTDAGIGNADVKDVRSIQKSLITAFAADKDRLKVYDLTGRNPGTGKFYNGKEVITHLERMNAGANDTVFVFHSGHGIIENPQKPEETHYLVIDGGAVGRKPIMDTISAKQPRLLIVLTDCCSNFGPAPPVLHMEGRGPVPNKLNIQTVRNLMLKEVGIVSITAAEDGKSALATYKGPNPGNAGSAFTVALMRLWYKQDETFTTWKQLFPALRRETGDASGGAHLARSFQLPK